MFVVIHPRSAAVLRDNQIETVVGSCPSFIVAVQLIRTMKYDRYPRELSGTPHGFLFCIEVFLPIIFDYFLTFSSCPLLLSSFLVLLFPHVFVLTVFTPSVTICFPSRFFGDECAMILFMAGRFLLLLSFLVFCIPLFFLFADRFHSRHECRLSFSPSRSLAD